MLIKKIKLLGKSPRSLPKVLGNNIRRRTNFDYRFLGGKSLGPVNIIFEITARCNLRCDFCWLWGKSGIGEKYREQELSKKEVEGIIDDLPSTCQSIYVSGGEPFIREDLLDIIKFIKSRDIFCNVTTNGTLIGKSIDDIINSGLDQINISVDGTRKQHDAIRGKGNFDRTMDNMAKLIKRKKERDELTPIIKMNTTISPANYENLTSILEMAIDIGVDRVTFQQLWFTSKKFAKAHQKAMKDIFEIDCRGIMGYVNESVGDMDGDKIESQMDEMRGMAEEAGIYLKFWPDLKGRGINFSDYTDLEKIINSRCIHPWYAATIKPNGDLVPCPDYYIPEYIIGNLREDDFSHIWNSKKFVFFRKKLKEFGIFPGCRRCCALV